MKGTTMALFGVTTLSLVLAFSNVGIAAPPVKSNQMVPLDVVVQGSQESIAIHGTVHVVTEVTGTSVQVHTNLVDTSSVGLNTGQVFRVSGSQSLFLPDVLDDLCSGVDVFALVQFVVRESYLLNVETLKDYAAKVRFYNQLKMAFLSGALVGVGFDLFPPSCDSDDGTD